MRQGCVLDCLDEVGEIDGNVDKDVEHGDGGGVCGDETAVAVVYKHVSAHRTRLEQ